MYLMFGITALLLSVYWNSLAGVYGKSVPEKQHYTEWTNKEADIYFLIDSSTSIWIVEFDILLKFVVDLVSDMDIGPTRVGVGVYSTDHKLHISINNNFTKEKLQSEIKKAPYLKGNTFISRALKGMMVHGFSSKAVRAGVPRIAVLLTDGMSRHKQLAADNATLAKREGIFIFTVGIGNGVDKDELREIASDPKTTFYYHASDFDNLKDIRSQLSEKMSQVELLQSDEGTCGDKVEVDTVFVFDESALGEVDTQKVKDFIKSSVNSFSMNSGNVRIGVVSATCHEGDKTLGQFVTREDFVAELDRKDGPDISGLVKRARSNFFLPENGARFGAKRRIILILQPAIRKPIETLRQASKAKHSGIEVFVIQLGTEHDKNFVNRLASNTDKTFFPNTANDLRSPDIKQKFVSSFCREI
uniref:VWFA domain-containing protein n=1 Tax=Arion vulgaris TaxID=1028688 RepID=A0A0B7AJL4_9EUPU